jgi:hypothetical protein
VEANLEGVTMKSRVFVALAAGLGVFAIAGTGLADKRTITDAEGDINGSIHEDFVSGTQGHAGKRGLVHTATVAGKADEKNFPVLVLNTKGGKDSGPEYAARVDENGQAAVVNLVADGQKPLTATVGTEELDNTYRYEFSKAAIGKPKKGYFWRFEFPDGDIMPNDGWAKHRLG